MRRLRKLTTTLGLAAGLLLAAGPALAHDCTNASKQAGAGSVAEIAFVYHVSADGEFLGEEEIGDDDPRVNPQGRPAGGFVTLSFLVSVDGAEPFGVGTWDVFLHNDLPDTSRLAGPGADACDGIGIDDVGTCLDEAYDALFGGA